jgi:hypothetical protein
MAIAKRPDRHRSVIEEHPADERAAEAFITGAEEGPVRQETHKVPILVRLDRQILARIDQVAKRRGMSRSGWVQYQLSRGLEEEEA